MFYAIAPAISPRYLITVNEKLEKLPVLVRVGQAVDVVGQAGRPKTITGFQTHTTPVLLAYNERAELGTNECTLLVIDMKDTDMYVDIALTSDMEGVVILRKNPKYKETSSD